MVPKALMSVWLSGLLAAGVLSSVTAVTTAVGSTPAPLASGVITAATSGSNYLYSLTLSNVGSSSDSTIGSFWFAWTPGEDFLKSNPLSEQTPSGWTASPQLISGGGGASIQFTANATTDFLQPGKSLGGFSFITPDSPAVVLGDSVPFPGTPTTTSVAYDAGLFSDGGTKFVFTAVPEPADIGVLAIAFSALALIARRRRA